MTLFGPDLVKYLPEWPLAERPDFWLVQPQDIEEWIPMPPQIERIIEWRSLSPVEWFEVAVRMGKVFSVDDYATIRAAASMTDDALSREITRLAIHCEIWCRHKWPVQFNLRVNQFGRVYLYREILLESRKDDDVSIRENR